MYASLAAVDGTAMLPCTIGLPDCIAMVAHETQACFDAACHHAVVQQLESNVEA
jgi:hypothetical protein